MTSKGRSVARIGIEVRRTRSGREQFRGTAYDRAARKHLRGPWTDSLAQARSWRVDAQARLRAGKLSAASGPGVRECVSQFIAGIEDGSIRTRSGHAYKPATRRGYAADLQNHAAVAFGQTRINRIGYLDVQRWADGLIAEGRTPSNARNIVAAFRALCRWARRQGWISESPCTGVELPAGAQPRDRIASPEEAEALISALPAKYQAALGLAVYAGLRLGELLALDRGALDLKGREKMIHVHRGWDPTAREFIPTKSREKRRVPINKRLLVLLRDHLVLLNHPETDSLLFPGKDPAFPMHPNTLRRNADKAWRDLAVEPLGFHEGRHTFASIAIAAGTNPKTLSAIMGHATLAITYDIYGHLLPGAEGEAADLMDAFLDGSSP